MKKTLTWIICLGALLAGCRAMMRTEALQLYDLENGRMLTGRQAAMRLSHARLVIIGEHHTSQRHHAAQLAVIEALHQAGVPLAIGLEMFRRENQADLDRWIAGDIAEHNFEPIYLANWGFEFDLYRPIFEYAREQKIPMIGLNIPRDVSSQVARQGFESLTEDQKEGLNSLSCDVTSDYREFIREAYNAHAHGELEFEHFCQAQLLWDTAMAKNALAYLQKHPDKTLVLLAGRGHARKPGIPERFRKGSDMPVAVLMPEAATADGWEATADETDYLIVSY